MVQATSDADTRLELRTIAVDYNDLPERIIGSGQYDWIDPDVRPYFFPVVGLGIELFETKIVHFGCEMLSEAVDRAIGYDWILARTEHLLAFGAKYPDEQRGHRIIELGSVKIISFCPSVLYLSDSFGKRLLGVNEGRHHQVWKPGARFLAVRRLASST